uniref:Uncharacterized protein n=1 Tax=Arundo donax TaxID=35708 RepID=A0A0A9BRA7_ARUDO
MAWYRHGAEVTGSASQNGKRAGGYSGPKRCRGPR